MRTINRKTKASQQPIIYSINQAMHIANGSETWLWLILISIQHKIQLHTISWKPNARTTRATRLPEKHGFSFLFSGYFFFCLFFFLFPFLCVPRFLFLIRSFLLCWCVGLLLFPAIVFFGFDFFLGGLSCSSGLYQWQEQSET